MSDSSPKYGPDTVLLMQDDNLIKNTSWSRKGFTVERLTDEEVFQKLISGCKDLIREGMQKSGITTGPSFQLDQYHKYIENDAQHFRVLENFKPFIPVEKLPSDHRIITERVSEICKVKLTPYHPLYKIAIFHFRIVRPLSNDNNPLHRDVWIDRLRNAVNIYIPLAGSNKKSSLFVVPGSHLWKESEISRTNEGAEKNGLRYTVPEVTGSKRKMQLTRPDPQYNEVLVFSPYLIHGGAGNLNKNKTRISIEMRFWRK